jgi:hypothetical protein
LLTFAGQDLNNAGSPIPNSVIGIRAAFNSLAG